MKCECVTKRMNVALCGRAQNVMDSWQKCNIGLHLKKELLGHEGSSVERTASEAQALMTKRFLLRINTNFAPLNPHLLEFS